MRYQSSETDARRLPLILLAAFLCAGCGKSQEGPPKYAVSGSVLVNGKPTSGVVVTLNPTGASASGPGSQQAGGVTNAEGFFELITNGKDDGVLPGEYTATFIWLETEFPPRDRFGGKFSDAKASQFRVTVEAAEKVLEPFELQF